MNDDLRTQGLTRHAGSPGDQHARLVVIEGGPPQTVVLNGDVLAIGRQTGNDLVLVSDRVSRRHARVVRDGPLWAVEDIGSFNGTMVNGNRIDAECRHQLEHKDVIQLCEYRLLFLAHVDVAGKRLLSSIVVDRDRVSEEADQALREFLGG